jgi:hypothetical protein
LGFYDFDDKNQCNHTNRLNHSSETLNNTADENRKEPLSFCSESRKGVEATNEGTW